MNTISLKEAKKIKLFNRVEKKYILTSFQLYDFYKYLNSKDTFIVKEDDIDSFTYHSIYYDTVDLDMYQEHRDGVNHRQKLRIREYSNGKKYLEIKTKTNGITNKIRKKISNEDISVLRDWIKENLHYNLSLEKELDISYKRTTFISSDKKERITVDTDIEFYNYKTGISKSIDTIIVEIKYEEGYSSDAEKYFESNNIERQKFSKYYNGINYTIKES